MASYKTFAPKLLALVFTLSTYLARYDAQIRARNPLTTDQVTALNNLETALAGFRVAFAPDLPYHEPA